MQTRDVLVENLNVWQTSYYHHPRSFSPKRAFSTRGRPHDGVAPPGVVELKKVLCICAGWRVSVDVCG